VDIDQVAGWVRTAATVLAVAALLVAAWGAWTMLRAVLDLVSRREVEGQVVRRRSYSRGNDRTDHFIAVDSGRSDRIKAWLVPGGVYARFREGGVVRATVGPRLERRGGGEAAGAGWGGGGAAGTGRARPGRGPGGGGVDGRRGRPARRPGDRGRPGPGGDGRGRGARPGGAGRPGAAADPAAIAGRPDTRLPVQAASGPGSVSVFTAAGDLVGLLVRVNRRFGDPDQGVGDEAFLRGDTIVVIKGGIAASIRVQGDQVPDRVAALRRLASTAAGRLASPAAPPPDGGRAGPRGSPAHLGRRPGRADRFSDPARRR
jgi:hypothetical protein